MTTGLSARALWSLGATQIIGYGTLYYAFALLAPGMAADFGWSEAQVFAALTVALLVGGFCAPVAGRLADRHGAATVMSAGSAGAALALALCALSPGPVVYALALVGMEVAGACVLYATAFVAIVQIAGDRAQRRITHLTLIAGFASTIFWPLTTWLAGMFDWRQIFGLFAVMHLGLCLPLHLSLRGAVRPAPRPAAPNVPAGRGDGQAGDLVLLLGAFAIFGYVLGSVTVHMLPLLTALGLGPSGALVAALFGPAQVASRVVNMTFGRNLGQIELAVIAAILPVAGIAALAGGGTVAAAICFALLFGMGSGLSSIVSGTVPLELFGREGYGRAVGRLSAARQLAAALAPFLLSVQISRFGATAALWSAVAAGLAGAALLVWLALRRRPRAVLRQG